MLILVRKVGEKIVIADRVVVTVEKVIRNARGKVKNVVLSFDAPPEFAIKLAPKGDDSDVPNASADQPTTR